MLDARGEPVSTKNTRSLEHFEDALGRFQSYVGDPLEPIEHALSDDPGFILGHAFKATLCLLSSERAYRDDARASIEAAEHALSGANQRERGHVVAARRWLDGDWPGACAAWEQILVEHPRDAFAVQAAHLTDFFLGDCVSLRDRVARALGAWDEQVPGYSYLLGMYAFGLEECNLYSQAEQTGRRALEIQRRDSWAIHAVTHVLEMQSRFDEGIEWLQSRRDDWAPENNLAVHNWWHLALYLLEREDWSNALEIYDAELEPDGLELSMELLDASALLWRMHLQGVDVGGRFIALAQKWREREVENGYYAFNDVHAMLAYAGANMAENADRVLDDMRNACQSTGTVNAMMSLKVGLPVCEAIKAFSEERYSDCVDTLYEARASAHRFGGSHAQRDIINQTLIEAALRAGRFQTARHLVRERLAQKPRSPLAWRFAAKARAGAGDTHAAEDARQRAQDLVGDNNRQF